MNGAEMIAAERRRQDEVEGWSPEHDDLHDQGELLLAAGCYLAAAQMPIPDDDVFQIWPWGAADWKPSNDPVPNLVKAGALIAAEIDRLQRGALR